MRRRMAGLATEARRRGGATLDLWVDQLTNRELSADTAPLTYGGETICTEITHGSTHLYADMGSGFRNAGRQALDRKQTEHHVLLSHLHWDHIMGLPLFAPIHRTGHRLHIYHVHLDAPRHIKLLFNGVNFPLRWSEIKAEVVFHRLTLHRPRDFGPITVTPYELDHPGRAYGFRIQAGAAALAIALDTEATRRSADELGPDADLYRDADLLLIDAQYSADELADRQGWGHASPSRGIELARRFGISEVWLAHHDPAADDTTLDSVYRETRRGLAGLGMDLRVGMAWDGLQITLPDRSIC